jgi:AraC family transcriptional regulator
MGPAFGTYNHHTNMTRRNDPVARALWFIESHLREELTLEKIEPALGVSRFHLSRAFSATTGRPIMHYVRARRLSEAARLLSAGAPDILSVALDAGYASHEAFTRAFREQFGLTPEALRAEANLDRIVLVTALRRETTMALDIQKPRMQTGNRLLIAGLLERDFDRIPFAWQRFMPYFGQIPGQIGNVTYGVKANSDDGGNFEYIAGVEVATFEDVQRELTRLRLATQTYAIFEHRGHVSTIRNTFAEIYGTWLPQAGLALADAPDFERYDERFDPHTGCGTVELWIPVGTAGCT